MGDGWPKPPRADWADDLEPPSVVNYTIRRGGTLENVANLFKIYHHEIMDLNPGTGLQQELAPNTRIVVYRRGKDAQSESVGYPNSKPAVIFPRNLPC